MGAIVPDGNLDRDGIVACVVRRGQVLKPVFHPLDRPLQAHRHGRYREFLAKQRKLQPKAAAHVRRNDPNLILGQAKA